jgi:hypothetical protein
MPHLFDLTAGGAALGESLATRRLLGGDAALDRGPRTLAAEGLPGIAVREHPWATMMGANVPAPEPAAELVPADQYYVTFRTLSGLAEFGDLLEDWGGLPLHAVDWSGRDEQVRARYEGQLCLPSGALAEAVPPGLVRMVILTGTDPYLCAGSDVTVLAHSPRPAELLAALDAPRADAARRHGAALVGGSYDYGGVTVSHWRTPLREVSLYRAVLGEFVVCSNSRPALERVIDARGGRRRSLAQSGDFRYMRTVFRADDPAEDGFAFLPDAFIRRVVGPAAKVGEKRRLEALAALTTAGYGALYHAWETGRPPADTAALCAAGRLPADQLDVPEGPPVAWDAARRVARSEAYNTRRFLTPLIELPVNKVTRAEAEQYAQFRKEYLGLWRQYFDPVGLCLTRRDGRTRLETIILPMPQSRAYAALRAWVGTATVPRDADLAPPTAATRLIVPLSEELRNAGSEVGLGDWFGLCLDDSPDLTAVIGRALSADGGAGRDVEADRRPTPLLVTIAVGVRDAAKFSAAARKAWNEVGLSGGEPTESMYKGVTVLRVPANRDKLGPWLGICTWISLSNGLPIPLGLVSPADAPEAIYQAVIGGGYFVSVSEEALRRRIDRWAGRAADGKPERTGIAFEINLAGPGAGAAVRRYAADTVHRVALVNAPVWQSLYGVGVLAADAPDAERQAAALAYLGFVPVAPDGSGYRYDGPAGEVVNERHGSPRRPTRPAGLGPDGAPARLLARFRAARVELRFREDGIHTTLTLEHTSPRP